MPRHLLTVSDLREVTDIFRLASRYEASPVRYFTNEQRRPRLLTLFLEPSTRTRLSFEAAAQALGMDVISVPDVETTRIPKGETVADTARVVSCYADIVVLRTPFEEDLYEFAAHSSVPVINAGNGADEHPTQALIDMHTIQRHCTPPLRIALLGDPNRMRAMSSFDKLLGRFPQWVECVDIYSHPNGRKPPYDFSTYDILYMNSRLLPGRERREIEINPWKIDRTTILKPTAKILHPLARNEELSKDMDATEHALYFEQVRLGLYIRMALLHLTVEGTL